MVEAHLHMDETIMHTEEDNYGGPLGLGDGPMPMTSRRNTVNLARPVATQSGTDTNKIMDMLK